MVFDPKFTTSGKLTKNLMAIEAARQSVELLPITGRMLATLRQTSRLASIHYSTQIEGNRLTPAEVDDVVFRDKALAGFERDEAEVRNYFAALDEMGLRAAEAGPILETDLQTLHGLVMTGRQLPTPYRDGQNVIRDSATGAIVYLPPEAKDVAPLMGDLLAWIDAETEQGNMPMPILAGLAHYQFATIHPYYDGNGRTARLLTNLVLHKNGYGLKGVYSLDEYYAQDLGSYYGALNVGQSHNYYEGKRAEADLSGFLDYFIEGMAIAFEVVRTQAQIAGDANAADQSALLRTLSAPQRRSLDLFVTQASISAQDLATALGVSKRRASDLCRLWVQEGFLEVGNPSKRARTYRLSDRFERLVTERLGE